MPLRIVLALLLCALAASDRVLAQNRVGTEVIRPPAAGQPPPLSGFGAVKFKATGHIVRPSPQSTDEPAILTDVTALPSPVLRTLERVVLAARSGELHQ